MVNRKVRKISPIRPILFFSPIILLFGLFLHLLYSTIKPTLQGIIELQNINIEKNKEQNIKKERIILQPIVDEWSNSVNGNKSIIIYDLDNNAFSAIYDTSKLYNAASLYKLFVVYEGYRRIESGEWTPDDITGYTGHTILECLDLSIRESNSPCAETLLNKIGTDELDQIIKEDFKLSNTSIKSLFSNAEDIFKILKIYYEHADLSQNSWDLIKDSMLNQPITTYDWRQGLPSGFSNSTKVYNKVGWEWGENQWNIYHDAAILEFPEKDRHFIMVVMTNKISNKKIAELGTKIEAEINKY